VEDAVFGCGLHVLFVVSPIANAALKKFNDLSGTVRKSVQHRTFSFRVVNIK